MRFSDAASSTYQSSANPLESTFMLADTNDRVDGFFSRPQRIASFEWSPNVGFHHEINPWELYFSNNKVVNRLNNFSLLRCKMHVRVMVNSTKFYYGRLMLSYLPMHQNDTITQFRPGMQADFVEASQRPCIIMDPTTDQVGEMTLPFVYPKSALLIPAKEWERMGLLTLADLTPLRNANGATDPITVTVFAWATDVEYSQPTSNEYRVEAGDEYFDGPISKPAHKIARFANHLADVPIIGLYARATEMIASAGAAVAKLFGYARPTITDSEHLYTPYQGKRLATTNVEDTCDPLSLDVKKEVPIDPRICGLGPEDQMAFLPLAKRETYLTSFDWHPSDAPDVFKFNIHATPLQRVYETPTKVHTIPAGWIASLFEFWRGSIKIRFEVVASSFHRGRLRIVYDPLYQATNEFNVNYTHVLDLNSENDYTMKIGWAQNLPYLKCDHLNSGNATHSNETRFTGRIGNGVLTVFVVNALTTPSEDNDPVTVNVYVSMCDDFEVQGPIGKGLENVSIPEMVPLEPIPPIDPPDPPQPEDPPFIPIVRGPVTYSYVGNSGYPQSLITAAPLSVTDTPGAIVIGGTLTSQNYVGAHTMNLNDLQKEETMSIDMTFRTDGPAGGIPDLFFAGTPRSWNEFEPGKYSYQIIQPVVTDVNGQVQIPLAYAGGTPLILDSAIADRNVAAGLSFPGDSAFRNLSPGISINSDGYGDYYEIPTGGSFDYANPGDTFRDALIMVENNGDIDFGGEVSTNRSRSFPGRGSTVRVTQSIFQVTNTTTGTIKLYSMNFEAEITQPESGEEAIQPERTAIVESVAGTVENLPQISDVFFGEVPSSFRQVMKRYTLIETLRTSPITKATYIRFANPRNYARGQVKPSDVSLWAWCMTPYLGWKGSTRAKIIPGNPIDVGVTISRLAGGIEDVGEEFNALFEDTNVGWEGSTTAFLNRQVAEAVVPWYSNMRFRNCRITNLDTTYGKGPGFSMTMENHDPTRASYVRYIAAGGEDYSLYMWISTPIVEISENV
jgi:hypothetical protein